MFVADFCNDRGYFQGTKSLKKNVDMIVISFDTMVVVFEKLVPEKHVNKTIVGLYKKHILPRTFSS